MTDRHVHFIGIGGIGMSGIAQMLLARGVKVSGSDVKESLLTRELARQGASISIGHGCANIHGADLVVYSSAITEDNPEIAEARRRNIPVIKRAQALAQLMANKTVVTVTGSHGKTTTTSLVSYLLMEAGLKPAAAIGGIFKNIDSNALSGEGEYFVAEADESDGSFLYYSPKYSIITNIDREHLDYYKDFPNLLMAYRQFADRTVQGGCLFLCDDDPNLKNMAPDLKSDCVLFGMSEEADIYPGNIVLKGLSSEFDCFLKGEFVGRFSLSLGGMHNISNSLAVIALGLRLGLAPELIKKALAGYKGAKRRLEVKLKNDITVIDDYAHHPTEIRATLEAIRGLNPSRVIAIFQPHRYTRTKLLLKEFGACFQAADHVIVTDIYAASEKPIEGVDAQSICDMVKRNCPAKTVEFLPREDIIARALGLLKPGDLVMTLGAGDITKISDELAEKIRR